MRHLLNTLFITTENAYLALDGENVTVNCQNEIIGRFPLHTLEGIILFSYPGASPALMGACAQRNIALTFCSPQGKFLARSVGRTHGNVLLRRTQYRVADDPAQSGQIARNFLVGKLYNARGNIERTRRDHALRVEEEKLSKASRMLKEALTKLSDVSDIASLRGLEGAAATVYFGVFDELILGDKKHFSFTGRNRRPPLDPVNAMLSFAYTLLASDCASVLESVGLDPCVGFLHTDRSGRASLALDLMEELRPWTADRFVLTQINNRVVSEKDFTKRESGAVIMTDKARKEFLKAWQARKREEITHPYLNEKVPWGLVPYLQALLLSRYLRGDIDGYPPFLWK